MVNNNDTKIRIIGAGPTGAMLAIALSRVGSLVDIIDKKTIPDISSRSRAYAITNSTRIFLERIKLWDKLIPYLVPFQSLYLEDREINKHVIFQANDYCDRNSLRKEIGWIIDHQHLIVMILIYQVF